LSQKDLGGSSWSQIHIENVFVLARDKGLDYFRTFMRINQCQPISQSGAVLMYFLD